MTNWSCDANTRPSACWGRTVDRCRFQHGIAPQKIIHTQHMMSIHRIMEAFGQGHPIQIGMQFNFLPRLVKAIDHGNPENLLRLNTDRQGTLQFSLGLSSFRFTNHCNDFDP